jgi:hypothetical protein
VWKQLVEDQYVIFVEPKPKGSAKKKGKQAKKPIQMQTVTPGKGVPIAYR